MIALLTFFVGLITGTIITSVIKIKKKNPLLKPDNSVKYLSLYR